MDKLFWRGVNLIHKRYFFIHIFLVVVVLILGIGIYFQQGLSTQKALAEQMLHRQQVVARAGAISIGDFLTDFGKTLAIFSTRSIIVSTDAQTTNKDLLLFLDQMKGTPVTGLTILNKKGMVQFDVNSANLNDVGNNLSDRAYFKWSMTANAGEYFVGTPVVLKLDQTKYNYIIPVASPIFDKNGDFNGTLVGAVTVNSLIAKYSEPLKISNATKFFLIDSGGGFVFSSISSLTGTKFSDSFGNIDFPGKSYALNLFQEPFYGGNEGKFDILLPDLDDGGKVTRFLASYSRIDLGGNNKWAVIVITPASDAFSFTGPFYEDQIVSLVYLILVVLALSTIGLTSYRVRQKRG